MAITHPQDLPHDLIQEMELFLDWPSAGVTNRDRAGRSEYFEHSPVLWNMLIKPVPMDRYEWADWRAFMDSLEGGLFDFLAYDFHRPRPTDWQEHVPSGQTGTNNVVTLTANQITVGGLPNDFTMRRGNMIGLRQNIGGVVQRGLFECIEESGTNVSGQNSIRVIPHVPTNIFTDAADADIIKPKGRFKIDYSSIPRGEVPGYNSTSFRCVQEPYALI